MISRPLGRGGVHLAPEFLILLLISILNMNKRYESCCYDTFVNMNFA